MSLITHLWWNEEWTHYPNFHANVTIHTRMSIWHDDVIKWKHFPRKWPFVRGIHRSPVNSPHKGQWRGALMFFFYLRLNKRLRKQSWGWWFETPSRPSWHHRNGKLAIALPSTRISQSLIAFESLIHQKLSQKLLWRHTNDYTNDPNIYFGVALINYTKMLHLNASVLDIYFNIVAYVWHDHECLNIN